MRSPHHQAYARSKHILGQGDKVNGKVKTENYPPPPRSALVPLSQKDSQLQLSNAITHFLPLRQAGVPRRGGGGG